MIHTVLGIVNGLITLYAVFMLVYCLLTWFIRNPGNPLIRVLAFIAEPPLSPIKKILMRFYYFQNSPVDFSPLILFFILRLIVSVISLVSRHI